MFANGIVYCKLNGCGICISISIQKKTMCNFYVQSEKVKKTKSKLEKKNESQ